MNDECECCGAIVEWFHAPQFEPGIATSSDGRVKVFEDGQSLIFPAPAADILRDARARAAARSHDIGI